MSRSVAINSPSHSAWYGLWKCARSKHPQHWLGLLWSFPNIGDRLLLPWTLSNLGYRRGRVRPMPALRHKWSNSKTPRPQASQDTSQRLKIHSTRPSTNYWHDCQGEQARGGEQVPSFGWKPHHKKRKDLDVAGWRTSSIRSECSASSKEVGQPGTEWTTRPLGGQACGRPVYNFKLPQFRLLMKPGEGRCPYRCFTDLRCSRSNGAKHQWYRPGNCPAGAIGGAAGRPNLHLRLTCKLMRDYVVFSIQH